MRLPLPAVPICDNRNPSPSPSSGAELRRETPISWSRFGKYDLNLNEALQPQKTLEIIAGMSIGLLTGLLLGLPWLRWWAA